MSPAFPSCTWLSGVQSEQIVRGVLWIKNKQQQKQALFPYLAKLQLVTKSTTMTPDPDWIPPYNLYTITATVIKADPNTPSLHPLLPRTNTYWTVTTEMHCPSNCAHTSQWTFKDFELSRTFFGSPRAQYADNESITQFPICIYCSMKRIANHFTSHQTDSKYVPTNVPLQDTVQNITIHIVANQTINTFIPLTSYQTIGPDH